MAKRVQINELFDSPDFDESNDNIGILSVWIPERGRHYTLKMGYIRKIWEENKLTAGIVDQKNIEIVALNRHIAELEKELQNEVDISMRQKQQYPPSDYTDGYIDGLQFGLDKVRGNDEF